MIVVGPANCVNFRESCESLRVAESAEDPCTVTRGFLSLSLSFVALPRKGRGRIPVVFQCQIPALTALVGRLFDCSLPFSTCYSQFTGKENRSGLRSKFFGENGRGITVTVRQAPKEKSIPVISSRVARICPQHPRISRAV